MKYPKCLGCQDRYPQVRGCCDRCYQRHHKKVREGRATWAELEAEGAVLPATGAVMRKHYHIERVARA